MVLGKDDKLLRGSAGGRIPVPSAAVMGIFAGIDIPLTERFGEAGDSAEILVITVLFAR